MNQWTGFKHVASVIRELQEHSVWLKHCSEEHTKLDQEQMLEIVVERDASKVGKSPEPIKECTSSFKLNNLSI